MDGIEEAQVKQQEKLTRISPRDCVPLYGGGTQGLDTDSPNTCKERRKHSI